MPRKKYLVVGLGNPGKEYDGSRHNIGFVAVESLACKIEPFGKIKFDNEKNLEAKQIKSAIDENELVIIEPQTYMNLSGRSVAKALKYYDIDTRQLIVISDDTNLELGQARIRYGGNSGGHNGLKSIIELVGTDFWRVRIGVGSNEQIPLEDYVMQNPNKNDEKILQGMIDKSTDYLLESISNNNLENTTIN